MHALGRESAKYLDMVVDVGTTQKSLVLCSLQQAQAVPQTTDLTSTNGTWLETCQSSVPEVTAFLPQREVKSAYRLSALGITILAIELFDSHGRRQ